MILPIAAESSELVNEFMYDKTLIDALTTAT